VDIAVLYPGVLDTEAQAPLKRGSSANGCHPCEIEIDPDTGAVEVIRYTAVEDFGTVINTADVRGQLVGGIAMGLGQALVKIAPTPDAMQRPLATSSFGHAMLRAPGLTTVDWFNNGLASPTNVFGAKACGEAGMSAAPPTIMNAIADALRDYPRARDLQMPAVAADIRAAVAAGSRRGARGAAGEAPS
jgi:carbon-monoxide dehydrogenase large subunit